LIDCELRVVVCFHVQSVAWRGLFRKNFLDKKSFSFLCLVEKKLDRPPPISEKSVDSASQKAVGGYYSHSPLLKSPFASKRQRRRTQLRTTHPPHLR
jgi:hypothetical protein